MRRTLAILGLAAVTSSSCSDARQPTGLDPGAPTGIARFASSGADSPSGLQLVRDVTILSPVDLRAEPRFRFDPSLVERVAVEVCAWTGATCGAVVARFTHAGSGSERLRLAGDDRPHYHVNWHTRQSALDAGQVYRVRVLLDGEQVGFFAVLPVRGRETSSSDVYEFQNGATLPLRLHISMERLGGDPGAPSTGAIPLIPFQVDPGDFSDDHPQLPGRFISFRTLLLVFRQEATVGEVNAVLDEAEAEIAGAISSAGAAPGILFLRVPSRDHREMNALLRRLRDDPHVLHAAQDVLLEPSVVSRSNGGDPPAWSWETTPSDGNWGLERTRVPQMWGWNRAVEKTHASTVVGVMDSGFRDNHPDLEYLANLTPGNPSGHGTHVAGTIGATFGNGTGVDGVNPFARLVVGVDVPLAGLPPGGNGTVLEQRTSWGLELIWGFYNLVQSPLAPRAVNISMGYNWYAPTPPIDANTNAEAQTLASAQGAIYSVLMSNLAALGPLPLLLVAAGNDSGGELGEQRSRWASPMANAGIEHMVTNVVVVESVADAPGGPGNTTRSWFSNVGAHISAPGSHILSTYWSAPTDSLYATLSGTSMASPHVAGLASYLAAVDPTLSNAELRDLLTTNAVPTAGNASPRIDAFATVMDIDRTRGNTRVLRMLVDIDDGTPDGNQRTSYPSGADFLDEDADGDFGFGDGAVDMSDFRRWRDWLLQVENVAGLDLDGSANHPKKDVNANESVGTAAQESVYPRGDFNGDGKLATGAPQHVPGALQMAATDLQVLMHVFDDPFYAAGQLPGLVRSGDLVVDATQCRELTTAVSVRSTVTEGGSQIDFRDHDDQDSHIYTLAHHEPPGNSEYTVKVEVFGAGGDLILEEEEVVLITPGGDERWRPECDPPEASFAGTYDADGYTYCSDNGCVDFDRPLRVIVTQSDNQVTIALYRRIGTRLSSLGAPRTARLDGSSFLGGVPDSRDVTAEQCAEAPLTAECNPVAGNFEDDRIQGKWVWEVGGSCGQGLAAVCYYEWDAVRVAGGGE